MPPKKKSTKKPAPAREKMSRIIPIYLNPAEVELAERAISGIKHASGIGVSIGAYAKHAMFEHAGLFAFKSAILLAAKEDGEHSIIGAAVKVALAKAEGR